MEIHVFLNKYYCVNLSTHCNSKYIDLVITLNKMNHEFISTISISTVCPTEVEKNVMS